MGERKCKYCGAKAVYYNELIDVHYCPDCSQVAREEWLDLIGKVVDYVRQHEEEADG